MGSRDTQCSGLAIYWIDLLRAAGRAEVYHAESSNRKEQRAMLQDVCVLRGMVMER